MQHSIQHDFHVYGVAGVMISTVMSASAIGGLCKQDRTGDGNAKFGMQSYRIIFDSNTARQRIVASLL